MLNIFLAVSGPLTQCSRWLPMTLVIGCLCLSQAVSLCLSAVRILHWGSMYVVLCFTNDKHHGLWQNKRLLWVLSYIFNTTARWISLVALRPPLLVLATFAGTALAFQVKAIGISWSPGSPLVFIFCPWWVTEMAYDSSHPSLRTKSAQPRCLPKAPYEVWVLRRPELVQTSSPAVLKPSTQ